MGLGPTPIGHGSHGTQRDLQDLEYGSLPQAPWPPQAGGARYGREEGSSRGSPPWPPPLTLGFILVSFTGKFADILGIGWLVN